MLYYWKRDAKNSQAEIDYVFAVEDQLIPIEVKSGASGWLRSMQLYLDSKPANIGVKLSMGEFDTQDQIRSVPLYLVEQLTRLISHGA